MPTIRGTVRSLVHPAEPDSTAAVIVSNDRWNAVMPTVAVVPVRRVVERHEQTFAVAVDEGAYAVAARVTALVAPSEAQSMLGPVVAALDRDVLEQVEDRLCDFFQLSMLLTSPRPPRVVGDPRSYPLWGELYLSRDPIAGERKRFIVVSPNTWSAAADRVVVVRTTTQHERDHQAFPQIQRGEARACCGETISVRQPSLLTAPRDRPRPSTTTLTDMTAIARGIVVTHQLAGALARRESALR